MLLVLVAADPAPVDGAAVHAAVLRHVVAAARPRLLAAHALELGTEIEIERCNCVLGV